MKIRVKANEDFKGEAIELVPDSFKIKDQSEKLKVADQSSKMGMKELIWNVDWKAGETYELVYTFDAPDTSPAFYLLGPLTIGNPSESSGRSVFSEARSWQVASDAPDAYTEKIESWNAGTTDWEDKDLFTDFGVPKGAVVEIAAANTETKATRVAGMRTNGSGLERSFILSEADAGGGEHIVMHVQTDANGIIDVKASDTADITFYLLGYWDTGTYVEKMDSYDAGSDASWVDEDLSGSGVSGGDIAEMVFTNPDTANEWEMGVEEKDSGLGRKIDLRMPENSGGVTTFTMLAKADSSSIVDVYEEDTSVTGITLVGYWSTAPSFSYVQKFETIAPPASDQTWTDKDLNLAPNNFGVPNDAVTEIILANGEGAVENQMGVRTNGGADLSRILEPQEAAGGGRDCARIHTTVDADSVLEIWHEDVSDDIYEFKLVGYWEPLDRRSLYDRYPHCQCRRSAHFLYRLQRKLKVRQHRHHQRWRRHHRRQR